MPGPRARLIPVADWSVGTNQAPGFMRRARGAAEEMIDLVVDLQGRPVPRKGYRNMNDDNLGLGTTNGAYANTRQFDQLVVVHWLGDEDTPAGIKRHYLLPRDASWVQDERGRLLYIADANENPIFIDLKDNVSYDWKLNAPSQGLFSMQLVGTDRSFRAERTGFSLGTMLPVLDPTAPATLPFYIRAFANTELEDASVRITTDAGVVVKVLFEGVLPRGEHRWLWDGRNETGEAVAVAPYNAVLQIVQSDGTDVTSSSRFRVSDRPTGSFDPYYVSYEPRTICSTFANPELNFESLPSRLQQVHLFFWNESGDPPGFNVRFSLGGSTTPNWATHLNIYTNQDFVSDEISRPIETGVEFYRLGDIPVSDNRAFGYDDTDLWTGELDTTNILDSYDHDGPVEGFHSIGAYGVGIWGAAGNRVYFNKIGNLGDQRIYALPSENALVPHSFPLSKSGQSPILHVHPAAHESALLAFKRDALHIIKGKGIISGLYNPNTVIEVDVDASSVIEGTGTASPRTVLTVGSAVYFVGSDRILWQYGSNWRGQTDLRDVGLPIQKYLNEVSDDDLENLVAFLYQNCYHLIMPKRVIVLDMTRQYWTSFSWQLKDAFWSRGGIDSESILYGLRQDGTILSLFDGDTDDGGTIGGLWRSNPVSMPSESVITGVIAVHTESKPPTVKCRTDIDDREGQVRSYIPKASNHFRCGMHKVGSRVTVQLETDTKFPRLDRIQAEIYPR